MTFNRNLIFIEHILDIIKDIERSISGINKDKFIGDMDIRDANVRRLETIGEAVKNISDDFRKQYPQVEWKKIAGTRDVIIHKYFEVDLDIVWKIICDDLPKLKNQMLDIKRGIENNKK